MHDIIFCFERSDKKYYGELLSPATNVVILNLFQDFFLSFPDLLPIFSLSSPLFLSLSFSFIKLLLQCAGPLSGYELANSLTCVTPTNFTLLIKTFITVMLVCNAS